MCHHVANKNIGQVMKSGEAQQKVYISCSSVNSDCIFECKNTKYFSINQIFEQEISYSSAGGQRAGKRALLHDRSDVIRRGTAFLLCNTQAHGAR